CSSVGNTPDSVPRPGPNDNHPLVRSSTPSLTRTPTGRLAPSPECVHLTTARSRHTTNLLDDASEFITIRELQAAKKSGRTRCANTSCGLTTTQAQRGSSDHG